MKRSIIDYVAEHAARNPEGVAIFFRDSQYSYAELEGAAARCRGALAAQGIRPGDRVCLVMSDSPEMVSALLAITIRTMRMRAISVRFAGASRSRSTSRELGSVRRSAKTR